MLSSHGAYLYDNNMQHEIADGVLRRHSADIAKFYRPSAVSMTADAAKPLFDRQGPLPI